MSVTSPTVSDSIADVIAERCEVVFGLMGNGNAFVISNLTSRGVRYISARHEAGTVAMADAYNRASGRITVATATYGAGFTNTLTALAEARQARVPLVLVVGDAPSTGRRPWDVDQIQIAAGLGVETLTVSPDNARAMTERAFEVAGRDRVPVVLAIPYDYATADLTEQVVLTALEPVPLQGGTREQIEQTALMLRRAKRPLIIAGRGAMLADCGSELKRAGDLVGALFATSVMARNIFESPWDLGVAGGFARPEPLELMRQADMVLVVGASLNMFQMRYGTLLEGADRIIQVDETASATNDQVTDFVQADAKEFSRRLLDELLAADAVPEPVWRNTVPDVASKALLAESETNQFSSDHRLNPRPFARALQRILPTERTIVQDGGHFSGWMPMYCSVPEPRALMLVGTAYQTIGLGFPAAVGAAAARPDRTTVLVTGDGGGLMALADMETMIRTVASGVIVVFNDAAYGAELHQYAVRGLDKTAMLIDEVDFAAVGRALGAEGIKIHSLADLKPLEDWVAAGADGVFVLDIPVSQEVVAEYMQESVAKIRHVNA